jgi:hypothetical protein
VTGEFWVYGPVEHDRYVAAGKGTYSCPATGGGVACPRAAFLIVSLADMPWLAGALQLHVVGVVIMLHGLYRSDDRKDERLSIGVGTKLGNGLLTTLLGCLVLANQQATWATQAVFGFALSVLYPPILVRFVHHPQRANIGYKG